MDTSGEKYFSKTKTKIIHRRVIYKNFLKKLIRYDKEIYLIILKWISIFKYFLNHNIRYQKKIQLIILQQIFIFYDTTCNFYDTGGRLN